MSEKQKYSITALSRKLKLDRGTIRERLAESGFEPVEKQKGKETLYELTSDEVRELGNDEYEVERVRKTKIEADLKEIDLAVKQGTYGSVQEFTEIVQEIVKQLRKNLLIDLPKNTISRIYNANSETEATEILKNAVEKEFQNLRRDWEKYLGRA